MENWFHMPNMQELLIKKTHTNLQDNVTWKHLKVQSKVQHVLQLWYERIKGNLASETFFFIQAQDAASFHVQMNSVT